MATDTSVRTAVVSADAGTLALIQVSVHCSAARGYALHENPLSCSAVCAMACGGCRDESAFNVIRLTNANARVPQKLVDEKRRALEASQLATPAAGPSDGSSSSDAVASDAGSLPV